MDFDDGFCLLGDLSSVGVIVSPVEEQFDCASDVMSGINEVIFSVKQHW